jgi:peptidoglycan/LPS O-acetylase OafA/YrhL
VVDDARPAQAGRYYLIQCLRLFAASFVVVFHSVFYVSTHGGQLPRDAAYYFGELSQLGILIFFAISGFVITSSVQRRTSGEFIWLRFLRIYPGYWLAVALVVALNTLVFGGFAWNRGTIFGLTLLPLGDVPAFSHHSNVAFAVETVLLAKGVVKEFRWSNPHTWLAIGIQGRAPQFLARSEAASVDPR